MNRDQRRWRQTFIGLVGICTVLGLSGPLLAAGVTVRPSSPSPAWGSGLVNPMDQVGVQPDYMANGFIYANAEQMSSMQEAYTNAPISILSALQTRLDESAARPDLLEQERPVAAQAGERWAGVAMARAVLAPTEQEFDHVVGAVRQIYVNALGPENGRYEPERFEMLARRAREALKKSPEQAAALQESRNRLAGRLANALERLVGGNISRLGFNLSDAFIRLGSAFDGGPALSAAAAGPQAGALSSPAAAPEVPAQSEADTRTGSQRLAALSQQARLRHQQLFGSAASLGRPFDSGHREPPSQDIGLPESTIDRGELRPPPH